MPCRPFPRTQIAETAPRRWSPTRSEWPGSARSATPPLTGRWPGGLFASKYRMGSTASWERPRMLGAAHLRVFNRKNRIFPGINRFPILLDPPEPSFLFRIGLSDGSQSPEQSLYFQSAPEANKTGLILPKTNHRTGEVNPDPGQKKWFRRPISLIESHSFHRGSIQLKNNSSSIRKLHYTSQ